MAVLRIVTNTFWSLLSAQHACQFASPLITIATTTATPCRSSHHFTD